MKVQPIIDRLKSVSTTLSGRIAGAAEFSAEVEAARLALPCAFVLRASGEATDADTVGAVVQMLTEDFAVVIAVDNTGDTRGQAGAEAIDDVLYDVIGSLLGWSPDTTHNALTMVRDDHVAIDRARLWHQVIFRTSSAIASL